jgi:DNA replication protein DnaC
MLIQQTLEQLESLSLMEMANKWQEQQRDTQLAELSFDERFAMLVDAQSLTQQNKRMTRLLADAKLRLPQACIEGVDAPKSRELDKPLWRQLSTCRFVDDNRNVLVLGATGTGKTYVECALGHLAVRKGHRVRYYRTSRLLDELTLARADGSYSKLLCRLARYHVLILDDFLISPPSEMQRRDLLEVLEDRYGNSSTICGSQLPVQTWHAQLGDPTLADALLDRLIHNAYRIVLKGPTRRKDPENAETTTPSADL